MAGNRNGIGTNYNSAITANSLDACPWRHPTRNECGLPWRLWYLGVSTNPQFQNGDPRS
jgi:hypothetical protein